MSHLAHPDVPGGSTERMAEINAAAAKRAMRAQKAKMLAAKVEAKP